MEGVGRIACLLDCLGGGRARDSGMDGWMDGRGKGREGKGRRWGEVCVVCAPLDRVGCSSVAEELGWMDRICIRLWICLWM